MGGFFFRNPNNRTGVYDNGSDIRLIADAGQAAGGARTCPSDIDATAYNLIGDALAVYENDPNCFVFNQVFPGGFTPSFGGDVTDWSIASGVEGIYESGTSYDFSVHIGENRSDFVIINTLNPSLGPLSPTAFEPGSYIQLEKNFNADFVTVIPMDGYDLNFAYGFEEDIKGTIEVGKLADLTIFSKDLMTIPEEEIMSSKVNMTIVGGQIVYSK